MSETAVEPYIAPLPEVEEDDDHTKVVYVAEPTAVEFHADTNLVRGIMGAIGSGKSAICAWEIFCRCQGQAPRHGIRRTKWAIIRNTFGELLDTTMVDFLEWMPEGDWPDSGYSMRVVRSKPPHAFLTMALGDGTTVEAEFVFLALDKDEDVRKLKSLSLTGCWINEAGEVPKAVFDMAFGRIRRFPAKKDGGYTWSGVIMDTNPPDDESWWYNFAKVELPPKYRFWEQPPAIIPLPRPDKSLPQIYVPNRGQQYLDVHGKIRQHKHAENVSHQTAGFDYWLDQAPGKSTEWVNVFLRGMYGSTMDGKPVYPEYIDEIHCPKEDLEYFGGLPLLLCWDYGLCYDDQTEVLTRDGWKFFRDVKATEDMVATRNPENGEMEYTAINFKVDRPYKGKMLEWSSQNLNLCVTPEHRVPFTHRETPDKVHWESAQWIADHMSGHHYVDVVSEWKRPDDTINRFGMSPDTFAEFMGIYLSEGSACKKTAKISIYQKENDPYFARILSDTPQNWTRGSSVWTCSDRELNLYLRKFGTSHTKRVPREIKEMSARQIKLYISSYTAGDGHVRTRENGSVEHTIFTMSKDMADDFQELAQKAGWNSSIRKTKAQVSVIHEETGDRKICCAGGYNITFKKKATRAEFIDRNFQEIDYDGRIYCLNVPYHTLYVRRNGRPSWNGNTPCVVFLQLSPRGVLRAIDEICSEDMGIKQFGNNIVKPHLMNYYTGAKVISVGDPAGNQRQQVNDELTCMQELQRLGIPTRPARTNNFLTRREAVAGFLNRMVDGQPGFQLSPKCKQLRKGFTKKYKYKRLRSSTGLQYRDEPDKSHPWSDLQDALQYGAMHFETGGTTKQTQGRQKTPRRRIGKGRWNAYT